MFEHIAIHPGDPIFRLVDQFKKDQRPSKVNLSIGLYYDEDGRIPLLPSVIKAETDLAQHLESRPYLPMEGLASFRSAVQNLLFGETHEVIVGKRVATIQTIGASGALRIGADFLKTNFPDSEIYLSDPTWVNHRSIFEAPGFKPKTYPYYDKQTGGLNWQGLLKCLNNAPTRSIFLFHPCCHNPTGIDLSIEQWKQVTQVVKERDLIAFMDMAYQGFGDGLEEDAVAVRIMATAGVSFFVSNSFSKNLSYYGERSGGLSVVCHTEQEADRLLAQLNVTVRKNYSSPAYHVGTITAKVMNQPDLRMMWEAEVTQMRTRIKAMRQLLFDALHERLPNRDFSYLLTQRGMFSYTGLSEVQIKQLRDEHAVYLIDSGRMCVAGLNRNNVNQVSQAIAAVMR